jgi:hypothetical protein
MNLFASQQKPDAARVSQIKEWVARRFELPPDAVVMVAELRCSEPGCPPLETMIAIVDGPGQRRQVKLHKPTAEIAASDVDGLVFGS